MSTTAVQTTTTPEQEAQEFAANLAEIRAGWAQLKELPATVRALQDQNNQLLQQLTEVRRLTASRGGPPPVRPFGQVSDECAREVAARIIHSCEKTGHLDAICESQADWPKLTKFAHAALGITTRTALTTDDIPLPSQYGSEIRELTSEFGVVRRYMSHYPIGMGTAKPARMGARPAFGSIAMSAAFGEKSPTFTFASLESHKVGGLVRLPRELDEQSIVPFGRFLSRYGAIEFARLEDNWAFNGDGTAQFDGIKGIASTASEQALSQSLPAGKTKPSDATLDDFRLMRTKVNKAALNGKLSAYYIDSTWESKLPSFNTAGEPHVYQRRPDGSAILDGYPVVWTDVLTAYSTAASPNKLIAVFGAMSYPGPPAGPNSKSPMPNTQYPILNGPSPHPPLKSEISNLKSPPVSAPRKQSSP